MTQLAETLLESFYEFWQDPKWPYARTKPVPGIFLAFKAGIVSNDDLRGRKIRDYPNNPLHTKIFPILMEMIEKQWIEHVEGKYGTPNDYNYSFWRNIIQRLCTTWISDGSEQIEEFKRMENTTSDKFPELWCFYLTSKGKVHYESIGVMRSLVDELLELQEKCNEKLKCESFISNWKIVDDIRKPSTSIEYYTHRIQSLNLLIHKMRIKELGGKGDETINFLEDYLRKRKKDPRPTIQNLRDISTLSSGYPRHEGTNINERVERVLNRWGFAQTNIDYGKLWKTSLEKYIQSLKNLLNNL